MSPETHQFLHEKIYQCSNFILTSEALNYDDNELWNQLSNENQQLLNPVRQQFRLHNACLNQVIRWQNHLYNQNSSIVGDSDFQHITNMLKISHELKSLGLSGFNFNDIERKMTFHDSGEIITGDIALIHSSEIETLAKELKVIEPYCFIRLILGQIRTQKPDLYQLIRTSYVQYESRDRHPYDKESHLVKLIDQIQGNEYGLDHIYRPEIVSMISQDGNHAMDSRQMVTRSIQAENELLSKVLQSSNVSNQDKNILINFVSHHQAISYGQSIYRPEYFSHRLDISSF